MSGEFTQDDYFKIDTEPHLVGDLGPIAHFPGVQMWWRAVDGCRRALAGQMPAEAVEGLEAHELEKNSDPAALLAAMDKYGVDVACLLPESMMDTTGYTSRWCTNGEMARVVDSNPHRFMYQPNLWSQDLQVLSARGHLHQRPRLVALLPGGGGARDRARHPHRVLVGTTGQEQVCGAHPAR
jgi:hypothetical protein